MFRGEIPSKAGDEMPEPRTCPSLPDLDQFLLGQVSERDTDVFQQHIKECARCQSALGSAQAEDTLVEAMRAARDNGRGDDSDASAVIGALMAKLGGLRTATPNQTVDFTPADHGDSPAPAAAMPAVPGYDILGI